MAFEMETEVQQGHAQKVKQVYAGKSGSRPGVYGQLADGGSLLTNGHILLEGVPGLTKHHYH